jgi:amino acid adenylation domain-containing protein
MTVPTGLGSAGSDRRRALLQKRLAQEGLDNEALARIEPQRDGAPAPLSFPQQQLWLFEQAFPGTAVYSVPSLVRLTGSLDHAALEGALNDTLKRHSVLHGTFVSDGGLPKQVISPYSPRPLPLHDLTRFDAAERERRAEERVRREIERGFDLSSGPLVRAQLIKVAEDEHLLVLNMHHIVGDAWSCDVLLNELVTGYHAKGSRTAALEPLPIQYGDFARWQRRRVDDGELAGQLAYWRERLSDPPPLLEVPTDRPRPAIPRFRGSVVRFELPPEVVAGLRRLSREENATLSMAALAVFKVLLHRYTGRTDIIVGSAFANRDHAQLERLAGFFVNTLPVRTAVAPDKTFRELLGAVRRESSGALAHQDLPFEKLVEDLNPSRGLHFTPFFQIVFSFRPAPRRTGLDGLNATHVMVHNGTVKRDLTLHVVEDGDRLEGLVDFDSDLYDTATVERMTEHYRRLASAAVAEPGRAIGDLPLLTIEELRSLRDRNDTAADFPQASQCLHEIFEAQVSRTPGAPAVHCEDEHLTYEALNRRANQLAHRLVELGAGPEVTVGICMDNSVQLIVAVLGVLKAGAAYVPLDPRDPAERRHGTLSDAGARIVVQAPGLLWGDHPYQAIELDASWSAILDHPVANLPARGTPSTMAYLLYTSGSTGKPKGVAIEHRQVVNYSYAIMRRLGIDGPLTYAMQQPLAVDSVVTLIYPPLFTGGDLHLIPRERALNARRLADYCREHVIHCFKIAPSHLKALQRSPGFADILPRRHLIVGGEASESPWMRELQHLAGECTIYNHYGHTETTVGMMVLPIREDPEPDTGTVPIGPPIANNQAYVLDENWQPVPAGVPGELCVGGANVGRGYHGRPDLTAAAFIPDPFGGQPGSRLYRSGDIVRARRDGTIEFLGRRDDQIKIRGFRVELGEIEGVLGDHPSVRDALVVVREDSPGEKGIVAYVVPLDPAAFDADQVREYLRERLSPHMMPSALVPLDALPLSRHGKVDRRALPPPPSAGRQDRVRLDNELERMIESIWRRLLKVEQVDVEQNFFDLGGHSLLIMRLHEELQKAVGREFAVIELFQHTTVRAQGNFLAHHQETSVQDRGKVRGKKQSELMKRRQQTLRAERGRDE